MLNNRSYINAMFVFIIVFFILFPIVFIINIQHKNSKEPEYILVNPNIPENHPCNFKMDKTIEEDMRKMGAHKWSEICVEIKKEKKLQNIK